jgi:hypothetical protein
MRHRGELRAYELRAYAYLLTHSALPYALCLLADTLCLFAEESSVAEPLLTSFSFCVKLSFRGGFSRCSTVSFSRCSTVSLRMRY